SPMGVKLHRQIQILLEAEVIDKSPAESRCGKAQKLAVVIGVDTIIVFVFQLEVTRKFTITGGFIRFTGLINPLDIQSPDFIGSMPDKPAIRYVIQFFSILTQISIQTVDLIPVEREIKS